MFPLYSWGKEHRRWELRQTARSMQDPGIGADFENYPLFNPCYRIRKEYELGRVSTQGSFHPGQTLKTEFLNYPLFKPWEKYWYEIGTTTRCVCGKQTEFQNYPLFEKTK